MAKLIALLAFAFTSSAMAKSLQLELYAQTVLAVKAGPGSEAVGGFSGFFWDGSKLIVVSDDRGKHGPPRFYELDLKLTPGKANFSVGKAQHLKSIPSDWILDLESIAPLADGNMVLSSEGDLNKKPRAWPHLFVVTSKGEFKSDISLPEKFLPETTGLQKKGIENNRAFEGLTISPTTQNLWAMNESPLVTDQSTKADAGIWVRLVEFEKSKELYKAKAEYPYQLQKAAANDLGPELFRGVSEILATPHQKMVVLERGARLTKNGIMYSGGLFLTDIEGAKDVSKIPNLAEASLASLKKTKLVDFEEILKTDERENFEALCWGPTLPNGQKSLLVMSDNNFSSREKTRLLIFSVKEVE